MNLEIVNNNYSILKQKIEKAEEELKKLAKDMEKLEESYNAKYTKLEVAKIMKNDTREKEAEKELAEVEKEIMQFKSKMMKQKEIAEKAKTSIDIKIQRIKDDPEISEQIDKALAVRYEKKLNKLNKEKDELVTKKEGLVSFQELVTKHPTIGNNLKGIISSMKQIKDIDNQINENKVVVNGVTGYKDAGLVKSLNLKRVELKEKFGKNTELLFDYCDRKNINKENIKKYIDMIIGNSVVEKDGKINLNETFNKSINEMNKKIDKKDQSIEQYSMLVAIKQLDIDYSEENKIQWWQLGKRFKNWINKIKRKRMPEQTISYQTKDAKEERKTFNENLKYDIVRDAMESRSKEDFEFAEKVRQKNEKENNNDNEIDDDELGK